MSLTLATFLTAIFFLLIGLPLVQAGEGAQRASVAWLRSKAASVVFFGGGAGWFLWHLYNLGPADFGQYKHILIGVFGAAALGAFFYIPDFLAVRGVAALVLLSARVLLDSAYMLVEVPQRLLLVTVVYLCIVAALYFGTVPYRLRDLLQWLWLKPLRARVLGAVFVLMGAALAVTALTY